MSEKFSGHACLENKTLIKRASVTVKIARCEMNNNEVGRVDANETAVSQALGEDCSELELVRTMGATLIICRVRRMKEKGQLDGKRGMRKRTRVCYEQGLTWKRRRKRHLR